MLRKYLWLKADHIPLCFSFRQRQSYIKPLSKSLEKRINHGEFSSQYGEWYRCYFEGTRPFSSFARARGTLSEVTLEHMMAFWLSRQPSVALSHPVKLWVTLKCQTDGHHCLWLHPFYMLPQLFIVRVMKLCFIKHFPSWRPIFLWLTMKCVVIFNFIHFCVPCHFFHWPGLAGKREFESQWDLYWFHENMKNCYSLKVKQKWWLKMHKILDHSCFGD